MLEIDGASNRGIDEIRQLRQNVAVRPSRSRFKIYIIDEVHMLTKEAFNALLKTLEEPPEHVKFIFATTEANKIPITILSRCQRFDFAGIDMGAIQTRLDADRRGRRRRGRARGAADSRQPGGRLDARQPVAARATALGGRQADHRRPGALRCLGTAPVERLSGLVQSIWLARDAAAALAELDAAVGGGVEVGQLLDQLIGYFRDVMAVAVGCPPQQMLYALPSQADEVAAIGRAAGPADDPGDGADSRSDGGAAAREPARPHAGRDGDRADLPARRSRRPGVALVAELRGDQSRERRRASRVAAARPPTAAKKNIEPRAASTHRSARFHALPKCGTRRPIAGRNRRTSAAPIVATHRSCRSSTSNQSPRMVETAAATERRCARARWTRCSSSSNWRSKPRSPASEAATAAPRVSRRQQAARASSRKSASGRSSSARWNCSTSARPVSLRAAGTTE